jgi:prophage antirepressor-like protein
MDILKAFKIADEEHHVTIKGTPEKPLFLAKDIGKILGIVKIRNSLTDLGDDEKVACATGTPGGQQEMLFLTEHGLYTLLARSKKPVAKDFRKWLFDILVEIRTNGYYELNEQHEVDRQLLKSETNKAKHSIFLKAFHERNVLYVAKLGPPDEHGNHIVKIGSTQNVRTRLGQIKFQYLLEPVLVDVVESNNYIKFENYIHNIDFIHAKAIVIKKKDNTPSTETYLLNDGELNDIIRTINENKSKFEDNAEKVEELKLKRVEKEVEKVEKEMTGKLEIVGKEVERLKIEKEMMIINGNIQLEMKKLELEILEKAPTQQQLPQIPAQETAADEKDLTTCDFSAKIPTGGLRAPKVLQYSPDNLCTPLKEFETPRKAELELVDLELSTTPLRNAAKNNTIYKGFRWLFLGRHEQPPETLPPTVAQRNKSPYVHYVAMIDIKREKILEVYATQKDATEARCMKAISFTRAIKQQSISSGHYWNYFEKCSPEMQEDYLSRASLPEKYLSPNGKRVQQLDSKTLEVIASYTSKRDVTRKFHMSYGSLEKACESGEPHNGYRWRMVA